LAARALAEELDREATAAAFGLHEDCTLRRLPENGPDAILVWTPSGRWQLQLPAHDPRTELLSLYLPICGATSTRPMTIGHLGQSLDGFIATPSGDSEFVTGGDNIVHLHRMRALCDAVVVGAGTVAADDPQLTTRLVPGPSPLRVVYDPGRRLVPTFRVFTDGAAPTLYVCPRTRTTPGERLMGEAQVVGIEADDSGDGLAQLLQMLHARGCVRVFVEGGGVTVSAFLEADLLDRLQIAIAPLLIGEGRPAIRLAPRTHLRDCRRPRYRVFRMGGDVLFDCELGAPAVDGPSPPGIVARVI
jgi:riboflavin-specific deaminase-like protein